MSAAPHPALPVRVRTRPRLAEWLLPLLLLFTGAIRLQAHPLNWTRVTVAADGITPGSVVARVEVDLAPFAGGYGKYRDLAAQGDSALRPFAERALRELTLEARGAALPWQIEEIIAPSDEDEFFAALPAPMTFLRVRATLPDAGSGVTLQVAPRTALELPVVWRREAATGGAVEMLNAGNRVALTAAGVQPAETTESGSGRWLGWRQVASTYTLQGFLHILPWGADHILFVLGLFFGRTRLRELLWQVSAFTVAHTLTLGLATLGWIQPPGRLVEPLIAASIVYFAVENWRASSPSPRRRLGIVFACGLLHGMGFAAALVALGLPADARIPALLAFNVGVELGQISVLLATFLLVGWWRNHARYRSFIALPASLAIGATALWWTVERTVLA